MTDCELKYLTKGGRGTVCSYEILRGQFCTKSKRTVRFNILQVRGHIHRPFCLVVHITVRVRSKFLIKLDIKPPIHLLEISTFSLNNVIVRLTKIMNRADKNWAHF